MLQLKLDDLYISLIQVYAPTEKANEDDIKKFYDDILVALSTADNKIILMGDFNAKIGHPKEGEDLIMGRYGYGERNERGELLIDFAFENKLSIMNTYFKKKESRRWTWISPDQKTTNEIDFIMTNQSQLITNIEVLRHVRFPSDHRLIRATLNIKIAKKNRKNFKPLNKTLKTDSEIESFQVSLKSYIENNVKESPDSQTYYNALEKALRYSLNTNKKNKKGHQIFSVKTEQLIKKRTELINVKPKDKEMKKELKKLFKTTNKSIKKDYKKHRQNIITRNLVKYKSTKRAFKDLRLQKTWIQKLESKSNTTNSRKDVINHATKFYKELYKKKLDDVDLQIQDNSDYRITIKPITGREVYDHIRKLKSDRSPGPDGIINEAIKLGAPVLLHHLTQLFNNILDSEMVPQQWCTSEITLIYKKGCPKDIGNYRPISLMASTYKLFASIILSRISSEIDDSQPIEQAGFRSGFSTTDHLQTLQQIMEKYTEYNNNLYLAFIDYSKAFDTISHNSIWKALKLFKVSYKYINILRNIYAHSTSRVKLDSRGDPIKIERGVRQGDPISPKLFIAVLESTFQKLNWTGKGIKIGRRCLNHLSFADDIVLLTETAEELEEMICSLDKESSMIGLEMNANKTRIMTNSIKTPICINGNNIEYVENYIYLGKQVSFSKTSMDEEIHRRANITWQKFWSLKEILKGRYSLNLKKVVMETCLLPSLLYGCQTWVLTNKTKKKVVTTQRAMERSILGLRKIHKVKSEDIRKKTKLTDALLQVLALKWRWAGHVARLCDDRWTIQTTRWTGPAGKRNIGRPLKRWADDLVQTAGPNWLSLAKDREEWKKMEEAFTRNGAVFSTN